MTARDKRFDPVMQPGRGQVLLSRDAAGQFADDLRRLKKRVHVFGRETGAEGQHHHGSTEEANFAEHRALAQCIGQTLQRAKNLCAA